MYENAQAHHAEASAAVSAARADLGAERNLEKMEL